MIIQVKLLIACGTSNDAPLREPLGVLAAVTIEATLVPEKVKRDYLVSISDLVHGVL